jgi:hypothetical protein
MSCDILETLGVPSHEAKQAADLYYKRDEEMVRNMAAHRDEDDEGFTNVARDAVRSLDELLRSDLDQATIQRKRTRLE